MITSAPHTTAPRDARRAIRVSLVIVNYNGGEKLRRCLSSVVRSVTADDEVIVVDNASTDGSAAKTAEAFSHITLVQAPANVGFGAGGNLGAIRSHGEHLVVLNPDTEVAAGWLEALLAPFADKPDVGLVTAKILLADPPDRINACGNVVHVSGLTLCRGLGAPRAAFDQDEEVPAISGAAFAIRRSVFEALGGFDSDFFLYMEDTDLSWRARLAGWRCWYTPHSVVRHEYALRFTPRKVFYQERNRYATLLKALRWPTLLALLPALLIAEIVTWGFVLWGDRANWQNKLDAYRWIVAHWSSMAQKRAATQALRKVRDRDLLQHMGFHLDFGQVGQGRLPRLAQMVFNPLFFLLRGLALLLVWW